MKLAREAKKMRRMQLPFPGFLRSSVSRWRVAADRSVNVVALPHPPPHLCDFQFTCLEGLLAQGSDALRWPNRLWTTARVAKPIQWPFGIGCHINDVGRFFCQCLGRSVQWPRRRPCERDDEEIRPLAGRTVSANGPGGPVAQRPTRVPGRIRLRIDPGRRSHLGAAGPHARRGRVRRPRPLLGHRCHLDQPKWLETEPVPKIGSWIL